MTPNLSRYLRAEIAFRSHAVWHVSDLAKLSGLISTCYVCRRMPKTTQMFSAVAISILPSFCQTDASIHENIFEVEYCLQALILRSIIVDPRFQPFPFPNVLYEPLDLSLTQKYAKFDPVRHRPLFVLPLLR